MASVLTVVFTLVLFHIIISVRWDSCQGSPELSDNTFNSDTILNVVISLNLTRNLRVSYKIINVATGNGNAEKSGRRR